MNLSNKDLLQILDNRPNLASFQNFMEKVKYVKHIEEEKDHE